MKARVVLPGGEMSSFSPNRPNYLGLALLFALASSISGCSCSQGYPSDGGSDATADAPMDGPPIDGDVPDGDGAAPDADVELCGNGQLDQDPSGEFGNEVCDPGLPPTTGDALRCICADDGNPCTEDVWVPDPVGGECYGECVHNPIAVDDCDDDNPCTYNDFTGTVCTPSYECVNTPIDNCTICDGGTNGDPCTVPDDDVRGVCKVGAIACDENGVETCQQQVFPVAEQCDGLDNDCDGSIDEGNPGGNVACSTGLSGVCAGGLTECHNNGTTTAIRCVQQVASSPEQCDALDNNCDGVVNEGNPGGGMNCATGLPGVCTMGTTVCSGNTLLCTPDTPPSPEQCNNIDDNCMGGVDEGNPGGGLPCTTGMQGVCNAGTTYCATGGVPSCMQNTPMSAEVCDGLDNDCDGMADENNPGGGASCSTGELGVCAAGTLQCVAGPGGTASVQCVRNVAPSTETCDAVDNDCDGTINEGNPGGGAGCNTGMPGVCSAGTTACVGTSLQCMQNMQPSAEICDSLDNNCDGTPDRGITAPDGFGNMCGNATTVSVAPGAGNALTRSGWIDSSGDDYFVVTFSGQGVPGQYYNPRIQLTNTGVGGEFVMNVYNSGTCGGSIQCGGDRTDWSLSYPANPNGCQGFGNCTDNDARTTQYYVRVKRASGAGATSCNQYTIRFSNQ